MKGNNGKILDSLKFGNIRSIEQKRKILRDKKNKARAKTKAKRKMQQKQRKS